VVGGWIWIARTRKGRWQTIGIGRRLVVLAVASRRRRILVAGMARILTDVSKFDGTARRGGGRTDGVLGGGVLAIPLVRWRLILSCSRVV
jgi:hypothetical protein